MFESEGERKNAPNCYFPIQCGSKMNMYGVKKEAINEVNNSDNSGKQKNDRNQKFSSCKCISWLIHFDNRHATAKNPLYTLTDGTEAKFCM